VVVVVPFAVVEELDWQKDVSGNQAKNRIARKASNFINKHLASGSSFIVVQTLEEDKVRSGRSDAWSWPGLWYCIVVPGRPMCCSCSVAIVC